MQLPGLHAAQCNSQEDFQFFERPKLNQYCRMRRDGAGVIRLQIFTALIEEDE
jgi:hypothetical protein